MCSPRNLILTPREAEVISAIKAGNSNKQIATMLSISEETAKRHLSVEKVGKIRQELLGAQIECVVPISVYMSRLGGTFAGLLFLFQYAV